MPELDPSGVLVRRYAERVPRSGCPDPNELAAFMEGRLDDAALRAHLATCDRCRIATAEGVGDAPCPSLEAWLMCAAGQGDLAGLQAHADECEACRAELEALHAGEAAEAVALLQVQQRLRLVGVTLSLAVVLQAARSRQLRLHSERLLHRSAQDGLEETTSRGGRVAWEPFGLDEDTYEVTLGEQRRRAHVPECFFSEVARQTPITWTVKALRRGQEVGEAREGVVKFLSEDDEKALRQQEAVCGEEVSSLALACLYEAYDLGWEAVEACRRHLDANPRSSLTWALLGRVEERMGRVQSAAASLSRAEQLR